MWQEGRLGTVRQIDLFAGDGETTKYYNNVKLRVVRLMWKCNVYRTAVFKQCIPVAILYSYSWGAYYHTVRGFHVIMACPIFRKDFANFKFLNTRTSMHVLS